jgi:hypothetical protein
MYCWIKDHPGSAEYYIHGACETQCDLCAMEYAEGVCFTDGKVIKPNYPVPALITDVIQTEGECYIYVFDRVWQLKFYISAE